MTTARAYAEGFRDGAGHYGASHYGAGSIGVYVMPDDEAEMRKLESSGQVERALAPRRTIPAAF